jgi:hypothetical protein
MAANTWASTGPSDEILFQNDAVSLCLVVNRRARTLRVVDFRAGPNPEKRMFVMSIAQRERVEKVYTLVERDEVGTWTRLGFAREGNIPGFYKRSDAFLLGAIVPAALGAPGHSETRMAVSVEATDEDDDAGPVSTAAADVAEATVVRAKKIAKDLADKPLPNVKLAAVAATDAKKTVAAALKVGRALTGFEPFGRDIERRYWSLTARGGFELLASAEMQACFGNAFVELLTAPRTEAEALATTGALKALLDELLADGVVSAFALAPSDDVSLATAFVANGFRRTGLLASHLVVGKGQRRDAVLWSRKLANPEDD